MGENCPGTNTLYAFVMDQSFRAFPSRAHISPMAFAALHCLALITTSSYISSTIRGLAPEIYSRTAAKVGRSAYMLSGNYAGVET
jgi:hypothetical protein